MRLSFCYDTHMAEKKRVIVKKKGAKKHGFMSRLASHNGKKVIKRRRLKGRKRV